VFSDHTVVWKTISNFFQSESLSCGPYWFSMCWKCGWNSAYCHLSDLWNTMYGTTGYVLFFSTAAIR